MKRMRVQQLWLIVTTVFVVTSLLALPTISASTRKLNGSLPPTGDVQGFKISSDMRWVVYSADQEADGIVDLYSVPLDGGIPIRLTSTEASVGQFQISPDNSYVVYVAGKSLYSAPLMGPREAVVKLYTSSFSITDFQISPDSSRVVFRHNPAVRGPSYLYSVPIAGPESAAVRLDPEGVSHYQVSPDSRWVVHSMFIGGGGGSAEVYRVPIAGPESARIKLHNAPVSGYPEVAGLAITSDGSRVVYRATHEQPYVHDLYSVPLLGPASASVKLNRSLIPEGDVQGFLLSPDGNRVVYHADEEVDEQFELYSVPLVGPATARVKLNDMLGPDGDVDEARISDDSRYVVYWADHETDNVFELYSVALADPANTNVKLNAPLEPGTNVFERVRLSPDSSYVVYRVDSSVDGVGHLYSVPLTGPAGASTQLSAALKPSGGYFEHFQVSPDSRAVVYRADEDVDEQFELYMVPLAGPATARVKLNGMFVSGGDVGDVQITRDGSHVVYLADQETDEQVELFVNADLPPMPTPPTLTTTPTALATNSPTPVPTNSPTPVPTNSPTRTVAPSATATTSRARTTVWLPQFIR